MIRKTLTILSLIGLLLCVGLWGVSYLNIKYEVHGSATYEPFNISLYKGAIANPVRHSDC